MEHPDTQAIPLYFHEAFLQAPKEVDRVDGAHTEGQQPHVHFKDGTSLNQDGTVHDAHKGTPNLTNSTRKWLEENGWKGN